MPVELLLATMAIFTGVGNYVVGRGIAARVDGKKVIFGATLEFIGISLFVFLVVSGASTRTAALWFIASFVVGMASAVLPALLARR